MGRNGQFGLSPRHGNRADRFLLRCGIVGRGRFIRPLCLCGGRTILHIEYVALADLKRHPRNPKDHDIGAISGSVNRWGFAEPVVIDERTGYLAAGHGRIDTLAQLKAQGGEPPVNVQLADFDGDWLIPVVRGNTFNSDSELEAFLVAANRLTILGGWNEPELASLLQDLAAQDTALLEATGYDADDLQALLDELTPPEDTKYSRKIEAPTYEPNGVKPKIADLYDDTRTRELCAEIDAADFLAEDERAFLKIAAQRHTVLTFSKIADFYAHSSADVQRLMENNALVIIDFNRAIELGYVQLTERIAALVKEEYGD
jgi:hypothetical protein